jgi:hypothetical protein
VGSLLTSPGSKNTMTWFMYHPFVSSMSIVHLLVYCLLCAWHTKHITSSNIESLLYMKLSSCASEKTPLCTRKFWMRNRESPLYIPPSKTPVQPTILVAVLATNVLLLHATIVHNDVIILCTWVLRLGHIPTRLRKKVVSQFHDVGLCALQSLSWGCWG